MSEKPLPPLSLYIHIPWCVRKCPYCDFNSHEIKTNIDENRYINALKNDLQNEGQLIGNRNITSVFFGGGTPSVFSPDAIHKILSEAETIIPFENNCEITMEANPGTLAENYLSPYRDAAINRLSLGIQSFDNTCLKALGRIHDSKQAMQAIAYAKEAGFDNFNLDLMFGLPDQTIDMALSDLNKALAFNSPHLSHYQLTIEENTYFHKHTPVLPETDMLWDMQSECIALIEDAGYWHYEVSAYAKAGKQCHHNLNYWHFGDYIGIGAGAHGKITSNDGTIKRRWKHRQPEQYITAIDKGNFYSGESTLNKQDIVFDFLLNALRLREGFTFDLFEQHTGLSREILNSNLAQVDPELLQTNETGLKASEKGFQFLNEILVELL